MNGDKDNIFVSLKACINYIKITHKGENIFGIFTYGDCSNIVCVVIPTFNEICLNGGLIAERCPYQDKVLDIVDIRYTYHATREGFPQLIESLYTDYYVINPRYEHMYYKLFRNNRDKIKAGIATKTPPPELETAIIKIMRTVLNEDSAVVRFLKQLNDGEKTAVELIVAAVGDEGIIKQGKIASAAGISRVTMSNLVRKMELCGVAEIQILGNKGTKIRIVDDTLLRIRA